MKAITSILAVALASCATSHVLVGEARPATSPASVRVYRTAPAKYSEIAFVHADGAWGKPGFQNSLNTAIARLKEKSAALGANGLILDPIKEQARSPATPLSGTAIWVP